jgi:hypothetical protein
MGVLRSYTAIVKGESAWYDYQAMLGDDVPLHTLSLPSYWPCTTLEPPLPSRMGSRAAPTHGK